MMSEETLLNILFVASGLLMVILAMPMIFPPWEVDGKLLIDGAASNPLPIDIAIQKGADVVLAMGFTFDYRNRFRSITAVQ